MADIEQNLTREELAVKQESLEQEALALGATEEEVSALVGRDVSMPTETDYIVAALDNVPPGASDTFVSVESTKLAALKGSADKQTSKSDLYDLSHNSLSGNFVDEVMEANLQQFSSAQSQQVMDFLNEVGTQQPGTLTSDMMEAASAPIYTGLLGFQEALSDIYYDETTAEREKRTLEVQGYYAALTERKAEEQGVLENISDGFGLILDPLLYTFDIDDLAVLDPTAKGTTDLGKVSNIIAGFQSLDPDAQASIAPELIEKIWEATGNNEFKASALSSLLFDPDFRVTIGIDAALDATVVLPTLIGGFKIAKGMKKMHTLRSKLKIAGSPEEAIAQTEGRVARVKDAMDADAMDWENNLVGADIADDDLAFEMGKIADKVREEVVAPLRELQKDKAIIKLDALTPDEKNLYVQSKLDALSTSDKVPGIRKAQVTRQDADGFEISYEVNAPGKKGVIKRTMKLDWSKDAAGTLIGIDKDLSKSLSAVYGHKILSPETVLRTLDDSIVSDTTFGGLQSSVMRNSLGKIWKDTEKSLLSIPTMTIRNGKPVFARGDARRAVDELLLAGDEAGEVWSVADLRSGNVQTLSGKRGYSAQEIEAYYAKRAFLDESHGYQNQLVRSKLKFLGQKHVKWVDEAGNEVSDLGKTVKDLRGLGDDVKVLRTETGMVDSLATVRAGAMDPSEVVVKFLKPRQVDGKEVTHGIVKVSDKYGSIAELPRDVLNKVRGYVPRVSKPGYYYVKNTKDGSTLARFKKRDNAQAWADKTAERMNSERVHGDGTDPVALRAILDRDFSAIDGVIEDANTYGGLFTGARSKDGVFAGDDLLGEVTRLSAGQSVNRMIDNIAFQMPMNEYRLAMMQRWQNTAKQLLLREGGITLDSPIIRDIQSPTEWANADIASHISDASTRNMLVAHRDYMIDSLKVAHKEERRFSSLLMDIAERPALNNKVADKLGLRDKVISIASHDPAQALKGGTFDAYLGWFNPRQLFVQTQNAALAVSMHPIHGLTAVPESFIQRAFLFTPTTDPSLMRKAAKGIVKDQKTIDDMIDSIEQFKKSGLRDGVMRTGDYASNAGGFSNGALDSFRAFNAKGRVFFEEGESMARLISWNVARKRWKAANPGKAIDDEAVKSITNDTLRMNMNMQRENAAWWQKNAFTSIPTQFLQVQAKLVENVVGGFTGTGKWTKAEAASALTGQIFLYGTGGVALAESFSGAVKEGYGGSGLQFAMDNPKANQFIDRGVTGLMLNSMGFENNFSESGSILAGLDDNIVWDIGSNFVDLAQGNANTIEFKAPSIGVAQRGTDAIGSAYQAIVDVAVSPTLETLGDSLLESVSSFAAISSTWSNARKALWLHRFGEIQSKDGSIIANAEQTSGLSLQTVIARASGFTTDIEDAYYKGMVWEMDRKQTEKDSSDAIIDSWNLFRQDGNLGKFQGNFALIMSEYENRPDLANSIVRRTFTRLLSPKTKVHRQVKRFLTDYMKSGGALKPRSFQGPLVTEPEQAEE